MKILFVSDVSIAAIIGGAERVLSAQSTLLAARGHSVHILTRKRPDHQEDRRIIRDVCEWRYPINRHNPLFFLLSAFKNSRRLFESLQKEIGFNVLLFHQPFSGLGVIQSSLSKKSGKVYVCHSLSFEEYISRSRKQGKIFGKIFYRLNILLRKWIEKRVLYGSDKIIILSRFTKDKLNATYKVDTQKTSIVPGGVDLKRFQPPSDKKRVRNRLKIPDEKVVLLTVRNLVPRMGLENLIKAIHIVIKTAPDVCLSIGGDGPLKDELIEMAGLLNLTDRIRFEGFIPEKLLLEYYQMADLFILPTRELEGFGLVTLEAMASGVPVAGTPVGGTLEILGNFDESFLFKDTRPQSIADLIKEKYEIIRYKPEEWEKTSQKCRQYVADNYSWEKHVDELEKILKAV